MLSRLFLGMSLVGSEWVLYILVGLSILSVTLILERIFFYRNASKNLEQFRTEIRKSVQAGEIKRALSAAQDRINKSGHESADFESGISYKVLAHHQDEPKASVEVLTEIAQDWILQTRLRWEKNLSILATIGSNAPFIGLFGTVLGIIQAFNELSQRSVGGPQTVTSGISEALIATAVGIFVAIPAVVAFNLFQRRVRAAITQADALKSFLVGHLSEDRK